MSLCPPKKGVLAETSGWNKLVERLRDKYGDEAEKRLEFSFYKKGDMPTYEEVLSNFGEVEESRIQAAKKYKDFLKEQPFTKESYLKTMKTAIENKVKSFKQMSKSFAQAVFTEFAQKDYNASIAKTILRQNMGEKYRKDAVADYNAKETLGFWNKKTYNEQMHFINSMENPKLYDLSDEPELKKLSDSYKKRMDDVYSVLKDIKDLPYIEDYFPHFWENPDEAGKFFASALSKRPMEGTKSFLRQRFFTDVKMGLDAGYKLITTNPEELVRIAEMNATKFKMAHDVFEKFKEIGKLKYVKAGETPPEGYELVKDKLFERMAPFAKTISPETVETAAELGAGIKPEVGLAIGGWYMPEDAARIVNNHLSRGLAGIPGIKDIYKLATYINNLKNTFQLGFSGFHLITTGIDAAVTTSSLGLNKILTGKPKNIVEGLKMMAKGYSMIPAVAENYAKANSVIKDFLANKSSIDIENISKANGRILSEKRWQINAEYNFKKAVSKFKAGDVSQSLPAVWNGLMIIPEYAAKPIMEYHVPRMKVAGFLKTVENELSIRGSMSETEIQKLLEKTWDDMDDRLGQVVYDNLFWDKSLKDLSFMTIRSFGWTGGTIRAISKGISDIPESYSRLLKGEGISPRTAWLINLPIQVGLYGGMLHYMFTGKKPEETKDYFFPKDGTKNPDGTDRRVNLPSYMKDVFSYSKSPYKTLMNKTSPFINESIDIYRNQDFYKQPVYNEDDEFFKKGLDILKYEMKSFVPFGFRKQPGAEQSLLSQQSIESKVGLTQAPAEFIRTDLEETINEQLVKEMDKARRVSGYKPEESAFKKIIAAQIKEGKSFRDIPLEEKLKAGLVNAKGRILKPQAVKKLVSTARLTNAQRSFKYLSPEGQMKVLSTIKKEDIKDLLSNRRILNIKGIMRIAREKPEFFQNKELKDAYKIATRRDYREKEEE